MIDWKQQRVEATAVFFFLIYTGLLDTMGVLPLGPVVFFSFLCVKLGLHPGVARGHEKGKMGGDLPASWVHLATGWQTAWTPVAEVMEAQHVRVALV